MTPVRFPWDQLSAEDRADCQRDLFMYGSTYARRRKNGKGYERVPFVEPEQATDEAHNFAHWWHS